MAGVNAIALINQKGGVGKTTTVANLGAGIAARGHRTHLIDLDPQSHLTLHFGVELTGGETTIYNVLIDQAPLRAALRRVGDRLYLAPSPMDLAAAEVELVNAPGREQRLATQLRAGPLDSDFVLIDCPPSLGLLTLNALAAVDEVLIPLQPHFLALQGLGRLLETISLVQQRINSRLRVGGIILCMFERITRLANEVVMDLQSFFAAVRHTDLPWADAKIYETVIRRNIKLAECPSHGLTIFDYDGDCNGAKDYAALAEEFLQMHCPASDQPVAITGEALAPVPAAPAESAVSVSEPVDKPAARPQPSADVTQRS